jgi:hypothetical protein
MTHLRPAILLLALVGCATDDANPHQTTQAAISPGVGIRVIGGEEILSRTDPSSLPSFNPNPGSSERKFWVPDGPPRAFIDASGQTRLRVPHYLTYDFVGPNLNAVGLNGGDVVADSLQSADPNAFNDATWPWSPWRLPDGRLAVVNHHEYHCRAHGTCASDRWYPALTLSIAYDGVHVGTPSYGVAARPPYGFAGDATPIEGAYSDPSNVMQSPIDGLYYLIAMNKVAGGNGVKNCVLRTADLTNPGAWRVFDGGSYSALPQNGAPCADVMAYGDGVWAPGSLSYSTYLNRFVYLAFGVFGGRQGFWARTSATNDLTQWSSPLLVLEAPLSWGDNGNYLGRPEWVYPSFLDPDAPSLGTLNFDRIGQAPYLYWVRLFAQEGRREVVRARVVFDVNSGEIANRMTGLYRIGGGGYYSNGVGQYCGITSIDQLRGCGWSYDFWALPPFNDHGANALQGAYNGRCACGVPPVPFGCYRIDGGGYFSNGAGHSCVFLGSQMQAICGTTNFWALPPRADHGLNNLDGPCSG